MHGKFGRLEPHMRDMYVHLYSLYDALSLGGTCCAMASPWANHATATIKLRQNQHQAQV